jgi:hypothetical protein
VRSDDPERWSPEAVAAAGEVLQDRAAGRAQEPEVPEEESPPPLHYDPDLLALGLLGGLITGHLIIPYERNVGAPELPEPLGLAPLRAAFFGADIATDPDLPVPFGPNLAWLALDTTDTAIVGAALGLRETREATWAKGIDAAGQSSVFITPPLADWTLVVGTVLFPPDCAEAFVKPLLEQLSRQFGDAQYFCTRRDVELRVWARARQGRLVRGYGWLGEKGLTLWDEGRPTKEERDLGFGNVAARSTAIRQAPNTDVTLPDEEGVMRLASFWSIDPTSLDEQFKEPVMGLLGEVPRADSRIRR